MIDLLTRGEAYSAFDAAAQALDTAKVEANRTHDEATRLKAEVAKLIEQAEMTVDRALLAYATTYKRLRSVIDLDTWDARRAYDLVKSAAVMEPLATLNAGASK